jgi:hypothetical protein
MNITKARKRQMVGEIHWTAKTSLSAVFFLVIFINNQTKWRKNNIHFILKQQ